MNGTLGASLQYGGHLSIEGGQPSLWPPNIDIRLKTKLRTLVLAACQTPRGRGIRPDDVAPLGCSNQQLKPVPVNLATVSYIEGTETE